VASGQLRGFVAAGLRDGTTKTFTTGDAEAHRVNLSYDIVR